VATDPVPERLAAASALGATDAQFPLVPRQPLDVVFEVAGTAGAVDDAVACARPGGRIVLVGIPASDETTFRASTARRKGLTLLLSRRMRGADLGRAIDLAAAGSVDLKSLVSARFSLDQSAEAFGRLARYDGLKTIVRP